MSQLGLLKQTAVILTQLRVPFMLSGSHAASLQGEPRTTHDIDVVVDLSADKIDALVARFPAADFYVNCAAVHQAVATRGMFNIIDLREGDKVDFWLLTDDPFDRSRFARRRTIEVEDVAVSVSSPEDTIIMKLRCGRDAGGSERQFRDALRIYEVQLAALDLPYIDRWIRALDLGELWTRLLLEAKPEQ